MHQIAALTLVAGLLVAAAPAHSQHPLDGIIVDVAAGETLPSMDALIARLRQADIVLLGEVHDNPAHHAGQAEIVAGLGPAALAFEMIPPAAEGMLARLRGEGAPTAVLGAALQWTERGWPDFAMYAPIFEAVPRAEVTGGAVDGDAMRLAMAHGAAAAAPLALGASARRYGLDRPLPDDVQADAVAEQIRAHCDAIHAEMAARMVEAQRLRDAAFADAALRARALANGGQVAVIAGSGHARIDRGVPAFIEAAEPALTVIALAFVEATSGDTDWTPFATMARPLFDFIVITEAADRPDPCIAFRRSRQ